MIQPRRVIYGIYFICCIGHYLDVVAEQMDILDKSGLLQKTKRLVCFVCNYNNTTAMELDSILNKYRLHHIIKLVTTPDNLYEKFAIENYKTFIPERNYYMYYFHTKGVSHKKMDRNYPMFEMRRKNLNFFILRKHEICMYWLDKGYDAVGTSLSRYPTVHFSGNFWWARSEHLQFLPEKISDAYLAPEMYICCNPDGKYISVCQQTNNIPLERLCRPDEKIIIQSTSVYIENRAAKTLPF